MAITVQNQTPIILDPVHTTDPSMAYDPLSAIHDAIVAPLLASTQSGRAVTVADGTDDITDNVDQLVFDCLGDSINPDAEDAAKQLFGQSVTGFDADTSLPINELYVRSTSGRLSLPEPMHSDGRTVIYTPGEDIIPAAKDFGDGDDERATFFVSLAYAYHPETLGVWFTSEKAFEMFKEFVNTQAAALRSKLSSRTTSLLADFQTITLDELTAAIQIRRTDEDNNEPYSFARLIVHLLMTYIRAQAADDHSVGLLPFSLGEVFSPRSLVFANVEAHASASAKAIDSEWLTIKSGIANPVTVLSNRQIARLDALPRAAARATAAVTRPKPGTPGYRAASIRYCKQRPPKKKLFGDVVRAMKRMRKVMVSHNIKTVIRSSYQRASRREPDNPDRPGRATAKIFRPDIHVYIDTSGSMSPDRYQAAAMMLFVLAKKLDVNIWVSSFSHQLSKETLLKVKGRSLSQIWKAFEAIPKVTGFTDFSQIWTYINASPKRQERFNLVITDFEWTPPPVRLDHPRNLYYAPVENTGWGDIVESAKEFTVDMRHIEPAIESRLLGLVA